MSSTLTVKLDSNVLELAEQEAQAHQTTLPEVVSQQILVMAQNWNKSQAGKTPITDSLRGTLKLPPEFNEETFLAEELLKTHGLAR